MKINPLSKLSFIVAMVFFAGLLLPSFADDPTILSTTTIFPGASTLYRRNLPTPNVYSSNAFQNDGKTRFLTEIQIALENNDSLPHTVVVTLAIGSESHNGFPGLDTTLATFSSVTAPAHSGIAGYQAYFPGVELKPNETYWVVFHSTSSAGTNPNGVSVLAYTNYKSDPAFPLLAKDMAASGDGNNWGYEGVQFGIIAAFVLNGPDPADTLVKGGAFSLISGATFNTLYPPAINGPGSVAYRATLKVTGSPATSIIGLNPYAAAPTYVARSGQPAADTGSLFKSFGDPILNDDNEVAFNATLARDGFTTTANDTGVWSSLGGTLHLAWQEGAPAPGLEETSATFVKASWINLQHGALFIGATTIEPGTLVRSSGIWKWNGTTLTKVVSVGQTDVLIDGVSHGAVKKIFGPASASNGNATSRQVSSSGKLVVLLGFTDKTNAAVKY